MNYRHAYHAGNFADVFKHAVFSRILLHLTRKETPFRVIETHAGRGLHALTSEEAGKTGEWRSGIGKILQAPLSLEATALLAPWLELVRKMVEKDGIYPGSPALAEHLTRPRDRIVLCEMHHEDAHDLAGMFAHSQRVQVKHADGWVVLPALLPPPERRGVVLIDPPFEKESEFRTILTALRQALGRWERGIYAIWYPIKARRDVERFAARVQALGVKALRSEIVLYHVERIDRLNGCGLIIVNPPWMLDKDIETFAPDLLRALAKDDGARVMTEWLVSE